MTAMQQPSQNFVRAYLRASTSDQDVQRARSALQAFAQSHDRVIASWYVENQSGAKADRSELLRLLEDCHCGDVLLVEQVDRLTRLNKEDWDVLKSAILQAGVRVVSLDLPTSHVAMTTVAFDDFTSRMLDAVNAMLLDMLAAVARKDYEDRRRRQAEGIAKAKAQGKYKGRAPNLALRKAIKALRRQGCSIRQTARLIGCSPTTVQKVVLATEVV